MALLGQGMPSWAQSSYEAQMMDAQRKLLRGYGYPNTGILDGQLDAAGDEILLLLEDDPDLR